MGGTTLAQGIGILASPILTRLYSPVDFGEFAVIISVVGLLTSVASLRYEDAVVVPKSDVDAANVMTLALISLSIVGLITLIVVELTGGWLLAAIGAGSLAAAPFLIAFVQVSGGAAAVLKRWAVRTKSFGQLATNSLIYAIAMVVAQVGLGLLGLASAGLLVGLMVASMASAVFQARQTLRSHASAMRQVTWQGLRTAAWQYRRFAILSTPSSFMNALGLRAPTLLLAGLYGAGTAGQFALAEQIVGVSASFIAGSVGQVFTAQGARLAHDNPRGLHALFVRTTLSLAATAIVPATLAMVLAPALFGWVFGQAWVDAGWIVAIVAPWYFVYVVANPTGQTLDLLGRQDLYFVREASRLLVLGMAMAAMLLIDLTPLAAVAALSIAGTVNYTVYLAVSWWALRSWLKQHAIVARSPGSSGSGADQE